MAQARHLAMISGATLALTLLQAMAASSARAFEAGFIAGVRNLSSQAKVTASHRLYVPENGLRLTFLSSDRISPEFKYSVTTTDISGLTIRDHTLMAGIRIKPTRRKLFSAAFVGGAAVFVSQYFGGLKDETVYEPGLYGGGAFSWNPGLIFLRADLVQSIFFTFKDSSTSIALTAGVRL